MSRHKAVIAVGNITKRTPGGTALSGVDFDLRPGEVHALVGENGAGIVMISSELPELMNVAHRIIVMSGGRIQDEMSLPEFDERRILAAAFAAHMDQREGAEAAAG